MVRTEHPHIVIDPHVKQDEPVVAGSGVRVRTLVELHLQGLSTGELHEGYPHLTMAQIHDALSYYYDHREEMDALLLHKRIETP
jgi:uncharacterized protein (DUF433 family)